MSEAGKLAELELAHGAASAAVDTILGQLGQRGVLELSDAGGVMLSRHALSPVPFADATGGVARANIIANATVETTGRAAWGAWRAADGLLVFRCSVGEAGEGASITLNSAELQQGATVAIPGFRFVLPLGEA